MAEQLWRDNLRQPGQDSRYKNSQGKTLGKVHPGKDTWEQESRDSPGQDAWDMTPRTGHQDRTVKIGQPREDSQDRTAKRGQPREDSQDKRATTGEQRQDIRDRTSGTGNPRQNIRDMTALWQATWDMENMHRTQAEETSSYKGCQNGRIYGLIPTQLFFHTITFWPLLSKNFIKNFKMYAYYTHV